MEAASSKVAGAKCAPPAPRGTLIRIRTTGGGGWGDPLARDVARVLGDVVAGKVSREGAWHDYGVVVSGDEDELGIDTGATAELREEVRQLGPHPAPVFDRGPGSGMLAGGAASAQCDW
jgi:N-methylhydantoinase B